MSREDKTPVMPALDGARAKTHEPALAIVCSRDPNVRTRTQAFVTQISVGRSSEGGVSCVVEDGLLSRRHFSVQRTGDGFVVEDHASTNGTFLDGEKVVGRCEAKLGSVIRFGQTVAIISEQQSTGPAPPTGFIAEAPAMRKLLFELALAAKTNVPIVIIGETGTGKEALSKEVHTVSQRSGPLVAVNAGAIAETLAESLLFGHRRGAFSGAHEAATGAFRAAHKGTLFLDEIGELPLTIQPKLLRALDSGTVVPVGETDAVTVDVRVVAATNVELLRAVDEGRFRSDLYARLAGYVLRPPPLRERREDIIPLARAMATQLNANAPLVFDALLAEKLLLHTWPMNARELRSLVQRWVIHNRTQLDASDFQVAAIPQEREDDVPSAGPKSERGAGPKSKEELLQVLEACGGVIARVGDHYGKNRRQVYRWFEKFGIEAPKE
jgi:transcriptional regulator with GAF, ATPase, and Fis domain